LAEFGFRYSTIKLGVDDAERTDRALCSIVGKRLTLADWWVGLQGMRHDERRGSSAALLEGTARSFPEMITLNQRSPRRRLGFYVSYM